MNRIIKLGCIASGMLTMLVSCQKENISSQEKGIVNISIRAIQDDETKTSLTAEGVRWNTSGEKLGVAHAGDKLIYRGEISEDGWYAVDYNGTAAWVSGKYAKIA